MHLDVNAGGGREVDEEVRRRRVDAKVTLLEGDGATKLRDTLEHGERSVVMQNPEGNEFCMQ